MTHETRAPEGRSGLVTLTVNGNAHDVPDDLTVRGLVVHLGLGDGPVAVELLGIGRELGDGKAPRIESGCSHRPILVRAMRARRTREPRYATIRHAP